ncbi:MAG: CDC48 family AAA ATPase [archaeon]
MKIEEKTFLTVKEMDIKDVGRGIAKLDPLVFDKLELETGDTIKIQGVKSSKSALAYTIKGKIQDTGMNIIRIDGDIRYNISATIDEEVTIEKVVCQSAKTVNLAPTLNIGEINKEVNSYIKENLINRNILENNIEKIRGIKIQTPDGSKDLALIITKTLPKGPVKITNETNLIIAEKPENIQRPGLTYDDIGGLKKEIEAIREMVELPIRRPEVFKKLGINPPKGILLYGPPGTGKTLLVKAVAGETDSHFTTINGPEIVSGVYGKSEENLRNIFNEASKNAPAIIFIDEIDAIAPRRENIHGETEKRIVAQLLTLMDGLNNRGDVVVIGATNLPDLIDPALRRPGRFDREIEFINPDKASRKEILLVHTRGMPLSDVNIDELLDLTNGFSGADLNALCREAALKAIKRLLPKINKEYGKHLSREIIDELVITQKDFLDALNVIEPSAIREIQVQIPNVKWEDIGGLVEEKKLLQEMIIWPIKEKVLFDKIGVETPKGILLYGPPGTGKTLLAKAVANDANINFISVKGPEIFNKWVGESEKKVRELFKKARQLAPSVIFFDEIDAITNTRSGMELNDVKNNVLAQILTEMDGVSKLKDIVIIGATNRIDRIDQALLRPGRFDRIIEVELPNSIEDREKIFDIYLAKLNIDNKIKAKDLSKLTDGLSGAEIESICKEAGMICIRRIKETKDKNQIILKEDFLKAISKVKSRMRTSQDIRNSKDDDENKMIA